MNQNSRLSRDFMGRLCTTNRACAHVHVEYRKESWLLNLVYPKTKPLDIPVPWLIKLIKKWSEVEFILHHSSFYARECADIKWLLKQLPFPVQTHVVQRLSVTNFIQLVSSQLVDRFSQTKLRWKAPNEGYLHMCGMHKSDNKWLRYQAINSCKSFVC